MQFELIFHLLSVKAAQSFLIREIRFSLNECIREFHDGRQLRISPPELFLDNWFFHFP